MRGMVIRRLRYTVPWKVDSLKLSRSFSSVVHIESQYLPYISLSVGEVQPETPEQGSDPSRTQHRCEMLRIVTRRLQYMGQWKGDTLELSVPSSSMTQTHVFKMTVVTYLFI